MKCDIIASYHIKNNITSQYATSIVSLYKKLKLLKNIAPVSSTTITDEENAWVMLDVRACNEAGNVSEALSVDSG